MSRAGGRPPYACSQPYGVGLADYTMSAAGGYSRPPPPGEVTGTNVKLYGRTANTSSIAGGIFGRDEQTHVKQHLADKRRFDPCASSVGPCSSGGLFGGGAWASQAAQVPQAPPQPSPPQTLPEHLG